LLRLRYGGSTGAAQRRKLREVASAVAESGVTVPQEVTDYLAKHGDDG
jgi:hypothetical protein